MAETLTDCLTDEELLEFYEKLKSKNQLEKFLKVLKIICDDNVKDDDNIDEILNTLTDEIIETETDETENDETENDDMVDLDENEELEKKEE